MALSNEEILLLLQLGSGDTLEYDKSQTITDLFIGQARRTPNAIAVVDRESRITYNELDEQSSALAHWLVREKGVEPDDFVVVMMPRVKEFMVAVLGIWKAGATYVPIDLEYPEERKRFIAEEGQGTGS